MKYLNLSLDSDLDSVIEPKVKTTYAYKIQSIARCEVGGDGGGMYSPVKLVVPPLTKKK